jgi:hypothetical protein
MDNIWLTAAIVLVPLLAGLALIVAMARGILNNPGVPNINAMVLGIAALLCVAPTILNLAITLPGGTTISLVKEEIQSQTQQIKSDFGAQGGKLNGQIEALRRRVAALEKERGTDAAPAESPNAGKIVVVLHVEARKDLAVKMQDYLLQEGYSANIVYTDFSELSDANRLASGAVAVVSAENNAGLRKEVEDVLRPKFSEMQNAVDSSSTKLVGTSVQVRLF